MDIKKTATSGIFWTFLDIALSRGVSIVASVLLARILVPEDFGLMAMIYIFTSLAGALVEGGLTQSLIRTKDATNVDYSTVFLTNLAVSVLLYLITFSFAPYIAQFYEQSALTSLIRVYSIMFIFTAFSAVQIAIFSKELQFKKLMVLNMPATIVGCCIGVGMALNNFGVWSIIGMHLTTQGVLTAMLWLFSVWKPKLTFSKIAFSQHFGFGYKLMLSSILNSFFENIYNIIIGKFYSLKTTGQFERAFMFSNYPSILLSKVIGKVTYPLMSNIQEETKRMYSIFRRANQMVIFISIPLMLILSALSIPLITVVLGDTWLEAASYFQILCLTGILYPLHVLHLNLIKVYGRSDWFLKLEIYKKILLAISVALAFSFGIYALVWSAVIVSSLSLFINVYYTERLIGYNTIDQLKDISAPLMIGIIMFVGIIGIQHLLINYSDILKIIVGILGGSLIYIAFSFIFKLNVLTQLFNLRKNYND